jgi:hypothetical protein
MLIYILAAVWVAVIAFTAFSVIASRSHINSRHYR